MADHLSQTEFERYRDRQLGVRELLRVDGHLLQCDQCKTALRALFDESASTRVVTAIERASAHLTYEQMEAFVDDKLSPTGRANVETHASICASCARELADMQSFAPEFARPLPQPADPARSLVSRLTQWISGGSSVRFGGAGMRAAVAVMVLAVGVVLLAPPRGDLPGSDMTLVIDRHVAVIEGDAARFAAGEFDQRAFAQLGASSPDALSAFRSGKDAAVANALEPRARDGDAVAQTALALLYLGGEGVAHNAPAAERLLRQAAEQGSASAAHNLGVLYGRGLLGATDEAEAVRWYARAKQLAEAKR